MTLPLYKTIKTDLSKHPSAADFCEKGADAVVFTSSSTVRSLVEQAEALKLASEATQPAYGSIGPIRTGALKELGLPINFESKQANSSSIVEHGQND